MKNYISTRILLQLKIILFLDQYILIKNINKDKKILHFIENL